MSKYGDIIKSASDLLSKTFKFDNKVKVETTTNDGVTFKSEGKLGAKGFAASVEAKFKRNNLKFDKLRIGTDGKVAGEMTLADVADGLNLTFKAEDGTTAADSSSKGVFGLQYTNADVGVIRADVDVINGPRVSADALFNYEGFLLGGCVKANTGLNAGDEEKKSGFKVEDYNVALGYDASDFRVAVKTSDTLSKVSGAYYQKVNSDAAVAAKFDFNRTAGAWCVAVGGKYNLSADTTVNGMLNSCGAVSGSYTQQFNSAVSLTAAAQVDAKQLASNNHKFGLTLNFKA